MKVKIYKFITTLIFLILSVNFFGCKEPDVIDEASSGVTLNFNGGTLHGKKTKSLSADDIAPYVGTNFTDALTEMDFGIELLNRKGFVFLGWTRTKNGNDYVSLFPTFGTIYAKWGEIISVTFDLNGGCNYFNDDEKVIKVDIIEGNQFDYSIPFSPYREGFSFLGWTTTKDGNTFINQPDKKVPIVYAKWQDNLRLFDKGDIIGDFVPDGEALNYEGEGIYTYEFVYDVDDNAWGSREKYGEGVVSFKLRPKAGDWSISYGSHESLNVDKYSVEINQMSGEGSDVIAHGLVDGVTYTIKIECNERGYCALRIYTGGNILNIGGDGDCIFTLDAGKAYFAREDYYEGTSKGPKKLTYKFTSGTSLAEIISSIKETVNDSLYVEYTDDYKIPYLYEEDGSYYVWREEIQDKKGNIISIDSDSLEKKYLSSSTTYTLVCRKLVSIVCDFNGGAYYSQDSMDVISTAGDSLDFDWIDNLYKDGYVFGGWTLTPNGEDYVTAIPDNDTTLYASWCYVLTIDAGKGTFINKETGEEYKTITKKFKPGATRGDVWSSIHAYGFGEWVLNAEEGQFVLKENKNSSLDVGINYEEDGISYAFNGCFDEYGDEIFEFISNDALKPDTLLETNTSWHFQYVQVYCVTYNLNGGTYEGSSDSISFYERSGFSIERSFELAKDRCIFKGWMLTQDGEDCIDLGSFHLQEDVTFYAKWEFYQYILTLDAGENKGKFTDENGNKVRYLNLKVDIGKPVYSVINSIEPSDYEIESQWYEFVYYTDESGNTYEWHDSYCDDIILYAKYEPYINVCFNLNGTILDGNEKIFKSYPWGTIVDYVPERDGYIFVGWTDSTEMYHNIVYDDIELWARWLPQEMENLKYFYLIPEESVACAWIPENDNTFVLRTWSYEDSNGNGYWELKFSPDYHGFGGCILSLDSDYVLCDNSISDCIKINVNELSDDCRYRFTLKVENKKAYVKVTKLKL